MNTQEKQKYADSLKTISDEALLDGFTNLRMLQDTQWEIPNVVEAYLMIVDEINHRGLDLGEDQ